MAEPLWSAYAKGRQRVAVKVRQLAAVGTVWCKRVQLRRTHSCGRGQSQQATIRALTHPTGDGLVHIARRKHPVHLVASEIVRVVMVEAGLADMAENRRRV